jgi:hypothetical protein
LRIVGAPELGLLAPRPRDLVSLENFVADLAGDLKLLAPPGPLLAFDQLGDNAKPFLYLSAL